MSKPQFITFTGADDDTPISAMIELSSRFPLEWGILVSANNTTPRFPSRGFIDRLQGLDLRLSMHICGRFAREIGATGQCPELGDLIAGFARTQINGFKLDPANVAAFGQRHGVTPILQWRGEEFPEANDTLWLFDKSGGAGIVPAAWPRHDQPRLVGYAGGLGPDNAAEVCATLPATQPYWIDMESRLRDANDHFSIDACRAVCERIFAN